MLLSFRGNSLSGKRRLCLFVVSPARGALKHVVKFILLKSISNEPFTGSINVSFSTNVGFRTRARKVSSFFSFSSRDLHSVVFSQFPRRKNK